MYLTAKEEGMLFYGFSKRRNADEVHCREGYTNADALLAHLENVGEPLGKMLEISTLSRLEVHGPVG